MSSQEAMVKNGLPAGLASTIVRSKSSIAFRFVVVDNSRSMLKLDGHRLTTDSHGTSTYVAIFFRLISLYSSVLDMLIHL
jgi:hypothetical protein